LKEKGRVVVFVPPKKSPQGILRKASETTVNILRSGIAELLDPDAFSKFFSELYWKANSLDSQGIVSLLKPDTQECGIQFRTAAEKFKLINDKAQKTILVRYGEGDKWINMLKTMGPERWLLRKLQRYAVNVYNKDLLTLLNQRSVEEIASNTYVLTTKIQYDNNIGLLVDEIPDDPEAFIQ
jgi:CRISPR-associated endonuclease/helicase Cas3